MIKHFLATIEKKRNNKGFHIDLFLKDFFWIFYGFPLNALLFLFSRNSLVNYNRAASFFCTYIDRFLAKKYVFNTAFIIVGAHRSGTSLVYDLLNNHPGIHVLYEPYNKYKTLFEINSTKINSKDLFFKFKFLFPRFFFWKTLSGKNARGMKIMPYMNKVELLKILEYDVKTIYVERRNILQRYLSYKIAKQSSKWFSKKGIEKQKIYFQKNHFFKYIARFKRLNKTLEKKLKHKRVLRITYTSIFKDWSKIQQFLELEYRKPKHVLKKQNPADISQKVINYKDLQTFLRRNNLTYLLDKER